jgi:hypothetical protein
MVRILKCKKGMSLTEIIVGAIMLSMVGIVIASIFAPTMIAFLRVNDFAEYSSLIDNVGNQIAADLIRSASEPRNAAGDNITGGGAPVTAVDMVVIPLEPESESEIALTYSIDADGMLLRWVGEPAANPADNLVFQEAFFKGKTVSFEVSEGDEEFSYVVSATITSTNRHAAAQGFDMTRDFVVRPLLLNQDTP